jgi:hypothetical protein
MARLSQYTSRKVPQKTAAHNFAALCGSSRFECHVPASYLLRYDSCNLPECCTTSSTVLPS